jgi:DNA invertase Pin-like site-specific DNA recombinase
MTRIFGYARGDGGLLDEQRQRITAYVEREGWPLPRMFVDDGDPALGSVEWRERPAGAALFAELAAGDVVIVAAMDRIFPELADALSTIERLAADGISLYLLDLGGDVSGSGQFPGDRTVVTTMLRAFARKD